MSLVRDLLEKDKVAASRAFFSFFKAWGQKKGVLSSTHLLGGSYAPAAPLWPPQTGSGSTRAAVCQLLVPKARGGA